MGVEDDARPVADEGAAALVADDGEHEVGPATPRQLERLEQQHAALGLEQVLGDEQQRRFVVSLRSVVWLDGAHAGADGGDAIGRQAVMRDQIVADIGAEGEDVGEAMQRLAFGPLELGHRPRAVSPGMDVMGARQRPAVVAIEVMLDAAHAIASRQVEGAGMKHVSCAQAARGLGHLCGEPAARAEPAQDLLAAERSAESGDHVAGRDAPLGKPAHARTDGLDRDAEALEGVRQVGRRTRPGTQVARIAEDAGDGHAIEAQRVTDVDLGSDIHREHGSIARRRAASDQPVTCPVAHARRHRLITLRRRNARQYCSPETRPHATISQRKRRYRPLRRRP